MGLRGIALLLSLLCLLPLGRVQAGQVVRLGQPKSKALMIGIDTYTDAATGAPVPDWPDLEAARLGALGVGAVLEARYRYQVDYLLDAQATRTEILSRLKVLFTEAAPDESIIVYFSGHGDADSLEAGYWIPWDAGPAPEVEIYGVSVEQVATWAKRSAARHILIISDSCFSGSLAQMRGEDREAEPRFYGERWYSDMDGERSVEVLTAGGLERVLDSVEGRYDGHSPFTYHLLAELVDERLPAVTAMELGIRVSQRVREEVFTRPRYASLDPGRIGSLVLRAPEGAAPRDTATVVMRPQEEGRLYVQGRPLTSTHRGREPVELEMTPGTYWIRLERPCDGQPVEMMITITAQDLAQRREIQIGVVGGCELAASGALASDFVSKVVEYEGMKLRLEGVRAPRLAWRRFDPEIHALSDFWYPYRLNVFFRLDYRWRSRIFYTSLNVSEGPDTPAMAVPEFLARVSAAVPQSEAKRYTAKYERYQRRWRRSTAVIYGVPVVLGVAALSFLGASDILPSSAAKDAENLGWTVGAGALIWAGFLWPADLVNRFVRRDPPRQDLRHIMTDEEAARLVDIYNRHVLTGMGVTLPEGATFAP